MTTGQRPFEFHRASDEVVYRFEPVASVGSRWKRKDLDLWCEVHPGRGWVIANAASEVLGWPIDGQPDSALPPAGRWQSEKDGKSYVYELVWV